MFRLNFLINNTCIDPISSNKDKRNAWDKNLYHSTRIKTQYWLCSSSCYCPSCPSRLLICLAFSLCLPHLPDHVNNENYQWQNQTEEKPQIYQFEISCLWQGIGYTLKQCVHYLKKLITFKNSIV